MRSSRARSASPTRGVIQRPKARAPQPYFGCSTRVAWLVTWCATRLSPEGHRLATTASPGAARRPENGRSKADGPNVALPYPGELSGLDNRQGSGKFCSYTDADSKPGGTGDGQ